jgi:hypothetical protein
MGVGIAKLTMNTQDILDEFHTIVGDETELSSD